MAKLELAKRQEPDDEPFEVLNWLSSKEAAKYLRKTTGALRVMVYRGYVRPRKFHRRLYFRKIELDRLLESSAF